MCHDSTSLGFGKYDLLLTTYDSNLRSGILSLRSQIANLKSWAPTSESSIPDLPQAYCRGIARPSWKARLVMWMVTVLAGVAGSAMSCSPFPQEQSVRGDDAARQTSALRQPFLRTQNRTRRHLTSGNDSTALMPGSPRRSFFRPLLYDLRAARASRLCGQSLGIFPNRGKARTARCDSHLRGHAAVQIRACGSGRFPRSRGSPGGNPKAAGLALQAETGTMNQRQGTL